MDKKNVAEYDRRLTQMGVWDNAKVQSKIFKAATVHVQNYFLIFQASQTIKTVEDRIKTYMFRRWQNRYNW